MNLFCSLISNFVDIIENDLSLHIRCSTRRIHPHQIYANRLNPENKRGPRNVPQPQWRRQAPAAKTFAFPPVPSATQACNRSSCLQQPFV